MGPFQRFWNGSLHKILPFLAPLKVKILCRDHFETLKWPQSVIFEGWIHNPKPQLKQRYIGNFMSMIYESFFDALFGFWSLKPPSPPHHQHSYIIIVGTCCLWDEGRRRGGGYDWRREMGGGWREAVPGTFRILNGSRPNFFGPQTALAVFCDHLWGKKILWPL